MVPQGGQFLIRKGSFFFSLKYVYVYGCVCVCVCVYLTFYFMLEYSLLWAPPVAHW